MAELDWLKMCAYRYMTQKLFAFAKGKCCAESCDNPMFQEVLLAGHLYQNVLKVYSAYLSHSIHDTVIHLECARYA